VPALHSPAHDVMPAFGQLMGHDVRPGTPHWKPRPAGDCVACLSADRQLGVTVTCQGWPRRRICRGSPRCTITSGDGEATSTRHQV
jgi:hypothetical protein